MRFGFVLFGLLSALTGCVRINRHTGLAESRGPKVRHQVRGAVQVSTGDAELQRLRERVIDDPSDTVARIELAAQYDRLGMKELALEHYRLIGVRRPEDEHAHLRYAQEIRETNPKEARRELREFVANYPVHLADTYSLLAILEDQAGDLTAGEALHRKAIELAPKSDRLHNNLGFNLAQQAKHGDAVKAFRKALALNGRSETARNNLAASLADTSAPKAFEIWKRSSGAAQAHNNLGALHLRNGRLAEARHELEEALRLSPALPEAWRNLAQVAELDGRPAQVSAEAFAGKGYRKAFLTGSTDAVRHAPVTEVGASGVSASEKINRKQKAAE